MILFGAIIPGGEEEVKFSSKIAEKRSSLIQTSAMGREERFLPASGWPGYTD